MQKPKPVINNISLDVPAHTLANGPISVVNPLRKSNPPKKFTKPIKTAICMMSFLFLGTFEAITPHATIGNPSKDGIKEVRDELPLIRLTAKPQTTRNSPYHRVIICISKPKNKKSELFSLDKSSKLLSLSSNILTQCGDVYLAFKKLSKNLGPLDSTES